MRCLSTMLHGSITSNCWPITRWYYHILYNADGCTNKFAIPNAVGEQKLTKPRSFGSTLFCLWPIFANTPWESMTMRKAQKHSRWVAQAQDSWPPTLLHGELGHIRLTFLIIGRQSLMVADDVAHLSSSPSSWPVAHTHTYTSNHCAWPSECAAMRKRDTPCVFGPNTCVKWVKCGLNVMPPRSHFNGMQHHHTMLKVCQKTGC